MIHSPFRLLLVILLIAINGFSQETDRLTQQADSLFNQLKIKIESEDIDSAQIIFDQVKAIDIRNDEFYKIKLTYYQANIQILDGNDERALKLLLAGYSNLKSMELSSYHTKYAEVIGRIYGRAKDFDTALNYFKYSITQAEIRNDSLAISSAYLNRGGVFQMQQQLDSAENNYKKVMQFHPKNSMEDETIATVYSNLIGVALGKGEFDLAEHYGIKSLKIQKQRKDTIKIAGVLSNLGSINMYTRNLDASNEYYFKAYDLLKNRKDFKSREIVALTLDNISQVFYLQEDYQKGYDYLFESSLLEKELNADKLANNITEIGMKYALVEEEKQTEFEMGKRKNAELWMLFLGVTIIGLIISLWLYIRGSKFKREKTKLEFQKEKVDQAREIEKMHNDVQIKILNATLDGRVAERRHISEILHGNVCSLLSSANLHLYAVKMELKEKTPVEVEKIEAIISEASDKVRDLSHKLISSVLLKFGLETAIEDLCEKYSNSRLVFKFKSNNIERYDESFEIKAHNIIEELANNIMKHSKAYRASIKLEQINEHLKIQILDDGDGFNIKDASKKNGLGLSQVSARVKVMNGKFEIRSYVNTGTQIYIDIPIPN